MARPLAGLEHLPPYVWPPLAACCGGPLSWSAERDWWRVDHAPDCRQRWQPHAPDSLAATDRTAATCDECGAVYAPTKRAQRFCSARCRDAANRLPVMDHDAQSGVTARGSVSASNKITSLAV